MLCRERLWGLFCGRVLGRREVVESVESVLQEGAG